MPVRQTSLEAYWGITAKKLGRMQRLVYGAVRELGLATDHDVAAFLGLPINCVTPCRGELEAAGLVRNCGFVRQEFVRVDGSVGMSPLRTQWEAVQDG